MPWDSSRTVHPGWLVVTGSVLAAISWVTVKLGWREGP
jgi:hypothetical protein